MRQRGYSGSRHSSHERWPWCPLYNLIWRDKPHEAEWSIKSTLQSFPTLVIVRKQRCFFTHMHFSPLTHFPQSQNDERALNWVKVKSNPERSVLFFSESTCTGQWYPMVYVFSCGVELCFDVTVFLRPCCSAPPGSLSQLFPCQMLCASRELLLPQPDTTPRQMPNSL